MKKAKLLSLLLALSLIVSFAVPGSLATETDEGDGQTSSGMVYSKTAVPDGDGGYRITLEAYATGSKVITQVTEDVPTDIVLVLDQSGSMDETMSVTGFLAYVNQSNSYLYNRRHNDNTGYGVTRNLYYKLSESSYVEVSVARNQIPIYTLIEQNGQNQANSYYYTNSNNLYALINGDYQKVTVGRVTTDTHWFSDDEYRYTYTLPNGAVIHTSDDDAANDRPVFTEVEGDRLYLFGTDYEYTYTYTVDNVTQTIGTSVGANTQPSDFTLYQSYTNGNISRLNALKSTVASFASSVSTKAAGADGLEGTADDVNHRIAVVGYASGTPAENPWRNSEVFIGANQYNYNSNASAYYASAFQDMSTTAGRNNITASIGALDADGATYTNLGMEMANGILQANPVPEGQRRNRVVIVFTDGIPGRTGYSETVANAALTQGTAIKNDGTTIYAIGVFGGADAGSAGNQNGNDTQKANWFMQHLSSGGGTPNSGYYLSAADAGTLGGIFQQISQNIETGGTSTTLTEETVIKDIIAPAFTLPTGANASSITLQTWKCTGDNTWEQNPSAMGATATVHGDEVSVTGFDFADNYVGTVTENGNVTYRGNKLLISFTVTPRPGFFGGNGVFTNDSAGIYENSSSTTPILIFDRPQVDVPLTEPFVSVPDADVYLGAYYSQTVPEDAVKMGATVTIGGYDIDFSKANDPNEPYGLQPWQVESVNISIEATTEGNNGSFENIQEDISYTVTVTVSPKTPGTSGDQSETASGQGTIHVFKPKLTFKDSDVWYGGAMPDSFSENLNGKTWINGNKTHTDSDVQMLNTEPELTLSYTPGITGTTVNTKQDVPVKVDVTMPTGGTATNINSHTTFEHLPCNAMTCGWNNLTPVPSDGNPAFLLHVNTCSLTITKSGGDNEPYVFTILKDGIKYTEASITGNSSITITELPIGTYSIVEDEGWSWRFSADNGSSVTLNSDSASGALGCNNTKEKIYWLNGFSEVVRNIFGGNNQ